METLQAQDSLQEIALRYQAQYQSNYPFPHISIDNFFSATQLQEVVDSFPPMDSPLWSRYVHNFSLKLACNKLDLLAPDISNFIHDLNQPKFLNFLTTLTGIPDLQPDPYFEGGGLHQITRGGFLGIHADFNFHEKLKMHRRINLLIYLNQAWKADYGGDLELWDREMQHAEKKIAPIFNRIVVFNTTDDSYHGHPEPLNCPENRSRKSIALYYYTKTRPQSEISKSHSTLYRARPEDSDFLKSLQTHLQPSLLGRVKNWIKKKF